MAANCEDISLMKITEGKTNEDLLEVKPYLNKYVKLISESQNIIDWNETEQDYAEYNDVLKQYNMYKLKRMLLGGAPYLYENENLFPMLEVAFYSRADIMQIILERHENEGTPGNNSVFIRHTTRALNVICKNNCGDIARLLLQGRASVTPSMHLNKAAKNGCTAVLDEILTLYPNIPINPVDKDGNTPLHKAIKGKKPHTVQYLLNHNANPNLTNNIGYNSVHMACQYADEDILHLLTMRGGDVKAREHEGKTPALIAAENGKESCIHILAAAGASLDQRDNQGNAPLIVAASQGHTNTVKQLIFNGASFDVVDNERYDALERAIMNKKDGAAAMIIRLHPKVDYIKYYLKVGEISLLKIVRYRLTKTLNALLDRMVVQNDPLNSTHGIVCTQYLEIDTDNITPSDGEYQKNKTFFLQCIAGLDDEEIAYHGTIRLLVDEKMRKFGYCILGIKIFFNVMFLLSLAYSLVIAAYVPIQLNFFTKDTLNIIRIPTELFVLGYFSFSVVTEGVEIFRVARLTYRYLKDKKMEKEKEKIRDSTVENGLQTDTEDDSDKIDLSLTPQKKQLGNWSIKSILNNNIFLRVFTDYFSDKSNYLDVLGLLTLFILLILRVTTQPTQWVFATLTFLINSLRSFKLIALLPRLGPYTNVIYKILVNDVPLFLTLFVLTLLIFTGGYFVSLRTPYTVEGFLNASLNQNTERIRGVDNEVQWVFLSALRILLEGNVYEGQYLFRQLNWLAALLYLGFLFLTIVVYLNVFIAQLSNTYGTVRNNAVRTYAWQRLNFIVQVQRTSLLSLCLDYRKIFYIKDIPITKEDLFKYFQVYNIKSLNIKSFTKEFDANSALSSIQSQQKVTRTEIVNINKAEGSTVEHFQSQSQLIQNQSQEIRELKDRMDKLVSELDTVLGDRLEKSSQAMLRIIEEKFN